MLPSLDREQPGQIVSSFRVTRRPPDDRSESRFRGILISGSQYELSRGVRVDLVVRFDPGGAIEELDRAFGVTPRTRKRGLVSSP